MSRYSKDRAINDKVHELARDGWRLTRGAKHWRLEHPTTGYILTVPGTPSDRRSSQNWFSQLRRAERASYDPRIIFGGFKS